ncbi:MAG: polysaccharide deacetylase family protein [Candidatus Hodarchaeota archaeon]
MPELTWLTRVFVERGIPITHAVEPANVTGDAVSWLKQVKKDHPDLIELVQHGWDHSLHGKGEFGGKRSYEDQLRDLKRGKDKLEDIFNAGFFPMLTIPFGVYNAATIKAANSLGYKVICSHYNYRISRRIFYAVGHLLGKGKLFGRHISNHLNYYPGTTMFEIDSSISFIKEYFDDYGTGCSFYSKEEIMEEYERFKKYVPVVVFLLHHRYHVAKEAKDLVVNILDSLRIQQGIKFLNYSTVYQIFHHGYYGLCNFV